MSDKRGPTYDSALEAMIAERFDDADPAAWREAAAHLRALFQRWERRLPPKMWQALDAGLTVAADTGDSGPLVAAASVAQYELRRVAKEQLIDRKRRTSRKLKVAVPPPQAGMSGPPKITGE